MKIVPKIMSNVCLTAHPGGCAAEVQKQIDYVKKQGTLPGPKTALILGCSGGYGLATRIALAYGCDTVTLGVSLEREPSESKGASVGFYNNQAFSYISQKDGKKEKTLNLEAFSHEAKEQTIVAAKELFGDQKIDLVVYSLASPMRIDPNDGTSYKSVLKPMGQSYHGKTVDIFTGAIKSVEVEPASEEEAKATIKVMGGEDWGLWIEALLKADLLSQGANTVAYSYIGPALTYPIYREGTIGQAKVHLENSAREITAKLSTISGRAYVSVNKALVTRASSVIPVVPLYVAILFKVMKEKGLHEGCIEQEYRMLQLMYGSVNITTDDQGRIRLDDYEMKSEIQEAVFSVWDLVKEDNMDQYADLETVRKDFMNLHGFEVEGINYDEDINPMGIY
ncbi:MAG: enoyl-ACP reductase FabV [Spirochaetia bacterium]